MFEFRLWFYESCNQVHINDVGWETLRNLEIMCLLVEFLARILSPKIQLQFPYNFDVSSHTSPKQGIF